MDDDEEGQGPSGYAWYQLGRMAAENDRHTSQTIRTLLHRRRAVSAHDALQAQNHALAAENAQLRQELADYKRNYVELDAWARRAERQIAQLLKERGE
jgi:cell division protein FtsB